MNLGRASCMQQQLLLAFAVLRHEMTGWRIAADSIGGQQLLERELWFAVTPLLDAWMPLLRVMAIDVQIYAREEELLEASKITMVLRSADD